MAADLKDNSTENSQSLSMSKLIIIKNLLILCLGFVFLFSAFMGLSNLQSTMNNAGSVGVASQSAIYCAFIMSTLFLPKLFIKKFGCKVTLVASMLTYSPYIAANFHPTMATLLPTAILLGAGAGTLWTTASSYINELSFINAKGDIEKAALSTSRYFGIFVMSFQTTQIWGNLVSYYVLSRPSEMYENASTTATRNLFNTNKISCGVDFCGVNDQALSPLPEIKRHTLIGIYFAFTIIAALVLVFFLDPLKQDDKKKEDSGIPQKLTATLNQMKKTEQLLLVVISTYAGMGPGFVFADYSEAYVACTLGLQDVGLVFVCFGIVDATTAFTSGRLLKYVPRSALIVTAATSYIGVCIALFCWKPNIQHVSVFYILVGFWGFSDGIIHTQLCALYGVLFRSDEEAAFANFRLWEAVGYLIAFGCSGFLCIAPKIYMQIGFIIVGLTGYIALEIRRFRKN